MLHTSSRNRRYDNPDPALYGRGYGVDDVLRKAADTRKMHIEKCIGNQ